MRGRAKGISPGLKWTAVAFGAVAGLAGCGAPGEETETATGALLSENGMAMNGMAMNGMAMNGMAMNGMAMNGMAMNGMAMNGLAMVNGLSNTYGLMTTAGGREVVKYIVKCAFPQGRTLTKQDQFGNSYAFEGSLGVAPELESASCDVDCQERVSACMLAHVNNAGVHIGLWLDSEGAIGWGSNPDYPYEEGSFFGNLFPTPWSGYFCNGRGWDQGAVPGRLGQPMSSSVYVNPFGVGVGCITRCTAHASDGYDRCTDGTKTYNHVVTVWRNYDPNTVYKICNYQSGKCLGTTSTAEGAALEQRTFTSTAAQKWWLLQTAPGKYRIMNAGSGKALSVSGLTGVVQKAYAGLATQQVKVISLSSQPGRFNIIPSSGATGLYAPNLNDGATVQLSSNVSADLAKWTTVPVGMMAQGTTAPPGTNPCASFCANPTVLTTASFNPGPLGVRAACYETTAGILGAARFNMGDRAFSVNGVAMPGDGGFPLPPPVNGGYCFQIAAASTDVATFYTY